MHGSKLATTLIALALGVSLATGCSKKEEDTTGNTVTDGMGLPSASAPVGSGTNETGVAGDQSGMAASPAAGTASTGTGTASAAAGGTAASDAAASGVVPGDHDHAATGRVEASDNGAKAARSKP